MYQLNEINSERDWKYIYRETTLYEFDDFGNEIGEERVYVIALVNKIGIEYPHPVTDFLREYRSSSMSLERERQMASTVCQFLNYTRSMCLLNDEDFLGLKEYGLYGLNFVHGSRFLQHCDNQKNSQGRRVKKDTVDRKEYVLINFYTFFQKKGIISNELKIASYYDKNGREKYVSPFIRKREHSSREVVRKGLRDFGENRQQLLVEFIDTALSLKKGKKIAFAMALQAFGGLRRGEVVNLVTGSLSYIGNNLVCDIQDRQEHLFRHKKNKNKEEVKKPRLQDILPSEYINNLYKVHMDWLNNYKKKVNFKVEDALFVNKSGYPLSGKSYEDTFRSVVQVFLGRLLEQKRYEEYAFLTAKPFTSHTLRGVFTNICLDDLNMNVRLTANARGDNWDTTVQDYVEELTGKQKMQRAIDQLAEAVVNAEISKSIIEKWSEGVNNNDNSI